MPPVRRRLVNVLIVFLALVSLLVCVGSAILWVRCGRVGDVVSWSWYWPVGPEVAPEEGRRWRGVGGGLTSGRGGVSFSGWYTIKAETPERRREFRWARRLKPAYGGTLPGRSAWGSGAVAGWSDPITGPAG